MQAYNEFQIETRTHENIDSILVTTHNNDNDDDKKRIWIREEL